jgi:hypothetical protein
MIGRQSAVAPCLGNEAVPFAAKAELGDRTGCSSEWWTHGKRRLILAAAVMVGLLGTLGEGWAQAKKRKVIRLETITVEGRVQKPQAFYILQRSNLNFEDMERSESFLPKAIKSVDKEPF